MSERQYRADIDGLRALAVVAVVLFHLGVPGFSGGFVGVDVFFVISGFLITGILISDIRADSFSYADFYTRRARRLFPALFTTLALSLLFGVLLLSPEHLQRMGLALVSALFFVSNFFFAAESGYFDATESFKPLLHTWSLSVEEQFYLVWPALLLGLSRLRSAYAVPVCLLGLGAASLVLTEWRMLTDTTSAFFLAPFRVSEFAIGALMVWLIRHQPKQLWWLEATQALGLLLVVVPIVSYSGTTYFPGLSALPVCFGTALLIYGGRGRYLKRLLDNRQAVSIGLVSYPLYLVHWPIIVFYRYWSFEELSGFEMLGISVAALVLATAIYHFIEVPIRRGRGRLQIRSRARFGLVCAGLALLLALPSLLVWSSAGWPARVSHSNGRTTLLEAVIEWSERMSACRPIELPGASGCLFGAESVGGSYDVALLGDSHSEHWIQGLDALFKRKGLSGIRLDTGAGTVPFRGGTTYFGGHGKRPSTEFAYGLLEESIDADTVVLAARWHLYYNTTGPTVRRHWFTYGAHQSPEESPLALAEAARDSISALLAAGKSVVVLGQVPPYGPSPIHCMRRPAFLIDFEREGICQSFPSERIRALATGSDRMFEALSRELDFTFVDMTKALCPEGDDLCISVIDEKFIYLDEDHLNRSGSVEVARELPAGLF